MPDSKFTALAKRDQRREILRELTLAIAEEQPDFAAHVADVLNVPLAELRAACTNHIGIYADDDGNGVRCKCSRWIGFDRDSGLPEPCVNCDRAAWRSFHGISIDGKTTLVPA